MQVYDPHEYKNFICKIKSECKSLWIPPHTDFQFSPHIDAREIIFFGEIVENLVIKNTRRKSNFNVKFTSGFIQKIIYYDKYYVDKKVDLDVNDITYITNKITKLNVNLNCLLTSIIPPEIDAAIKSFIVEFKNSKFEFNKSDEGFFSRSNLNEIEMIEKRMWQLIPD